MEHMKYTQHCIFSGSLPAFGRKAHLFVDLIYPDIPFAPRVKHMSNSEESEGHTHRRPTITLSAPCNYACHKHPQQDGSPCQTLTCGVGAAGRAESGALMHKPLHAGLNNGSKYTQAAGATWRSALMTTACRWMMTDACSAVHC